MQTIVKNINNLLSSICCCMALDSHSPIENVEHKQLFGQFAFVEFNPTPKDFTKHTYHSRSIDRPRHTGIHICTNKFCGLYKRPLEHNDYRMCIVSRLHRYKCRSSYPVWNHNYTHKGKIYHKSMHEYDNHLSCDKSLCILFRVFLCVEHKKRQD